MLNLFLWYGSKALESLVPTKEGSSKSESQETADHQHSAQHHECYACVEDVCPVHHLPAGLGLHHRSHTAEIQEKQITTTFLQSADGK